MKPDAGDVRAAVGVCFGGGVYVSVCVCVHCVCISPVFIASLIKLSHQLH